MSNFSYWKNEIADMPTQDDKGWYDLETGLRFDPECHYKTGGKISRWKPSEKVADYRKAAKFYCGKALTGSKAQKEWGEKIRFEFIQSDHLNDDEKAEVVGLGGWVGSAKFWIENRSSLKVISIDNLKKELQALRGKEREWNSAFYATHETVKKDKIRAEIKAHHDNMSIWIPAEFNPS